MKSMLMYAIVAALAVSCATPRPTVTVEGSDAVAAPKPKAPTGDSDKPRGSEPVDLDAIEEDRAEDLDSGGEPEQTGNEAINLDGDE